MIEHECTLFEPEAHVPAPVPEMPITSGQARRIHKLQTELDELFAARAGGNMSIGQQERVEAIFNEIDAVYGGRG